MHEYAQALALVDNLIDDYDNNVPLINTLSVAVDSWESSSPEFNLSPAMFFDPR